MQRDEKYITLKKIAEVLEENYSTIRHYKRRFNVYLDARVFGRQVRYSIQNIELFREILDFKEDGYANDEIEMILMDKKIIRQGDNEIMGQADKEVSQQISEQASKEVSEQVVQQVSEQSSEEESRQVSQEVSGQSDREVGKQVFQVVVQFGTYREDIFVKVSFYFFVDLLVYFPTYLLICLFTHLLTYFLTYLLTDFPI